MVVRSAGSTTLKVSGVTVAGEEGAWDVIDHCQRDIPSGTDCRIEVTVTAPADLTGQLAARLTIKHNANGCRSTVQLVAPAG
jgi:hypothetical protein